MAKIPDIKGELAVVTGASGGIGLEFCRQLAQRGANLLMVAIDDEPLQQAAAEIENIFGVKAWPLTLNLCDHDAPDRIYAWLEARSLKPSILINNAGIFSFAPATDLPEAKTEAFIDLHVRAATILSLRFAAFFKQQRHGYILNMSSMSCWMPMPGIAMYAATKAYIRVFTRALHYEMRDYGVRVTAACPGGIATDLFGLPEHLKRLALRLKAIARPDDFAHVAVKKMLQGKQQYINGFTNRLAILSIGMLPTRARMAVKHQLLDKGIQKK